MTQPSTLPPFAAIVVAAGAGLRAGQPVPKQFANWRGKPLVRHSVEAFLNAGAEPVVVVIPDGAEDITHEALNGLEGFLTIAGGETRQASVMQGLDLLTAFNPERVLIHDAARPGLPHAVIARLLVALDSNSGAIPILPIVDSLVVEGEGKMVGSADRKALRRVQTPQAFRFDDILAAHRAWQGEQDAGDDAQVLRAVDGEVALVEGSEELAKVTFAQDFTTPVTIVRTGMGFDVHRLVEGEELWLGGIQIDHDKGLAGHSDADVALHALVDALLGAIGAGDIGDHFPPGDPQWKGASSDRFLAHAAALVSEAGYTISNVDLTIICEAPKIGPHRDTMRDRIAQLLQCGVEQVSVKATTTERLGLTGRGEGIAAQAVATVGK